MPRLFVLDVPEFRQIAESLDTKNLPCEKKSGYLCYSSEEPIEIVREDMIDATWFGFPIAGIDGDLVEHSDRVFRLE